MILSSSYSSVRKRAEEEERRDEPDLRCPVIPTGEFLPIPPSPAFMLPPLPFLAINGDPPVFMRGGDAESCPLAALGPAPPSIVSFHCICPRLLLSCLCPDTPPTLLAAPLNDPVLPCPPPPPFIPPTRTPDPLPSALPLREWPAPPVERDRGRFCTDPMMEIASSPA